MSLLAFLDYAGVAVFAATGALSASRKQLDLVGFLFLAAATGIGGGTVRDLVLGNIPVFWVVNPTYILVCAAIGAVVFFTSHLVESRYRLLIWLDAVGLSAYCVMGAAKGMAAASSKLRLEGLGASVLALARTYSAQVPMAEPNTSSPSPKK